MKKARYAIKNIDWVKFMDRRRSCFIYHPFIEAEFSGTKKTAGFQFKRNLYKWAGEKGTQYRSAKEFENSLNYFLRIVESSPEKIQEWIEAGLKWNEEAQKLMSLFKTNKKKTVVLEEFEDYYDKFVQILLYTVTIPYFVVTSIDAVVKRGEPQKRFKKVLDIMGSLRGVATYPNLERTMLAHFLKLLSERSGIREIDLVDKLNPKEIVSFIKSGKPISRKELEQRRQWCVFWFDPVTKKIVYEYDKAIMDHIPALKEEIVAAEVVSGNVAFPGHIKGVVCRVDNVGDMKKYRKGQIIVSINTNPDLMPVLKTAKAIVSDEGGIMCHAAIVSRELKIPCIVGTKIATQVLKDGDLVEVDAEKGMVRILRRAKP